MSKKTLSSQELLIMISGLLENQVLELIVSGTDPGIVYVPYMMNDAVEYYLVLKNVRITGDLPEEFPENTAVRTAEQGGRKGLLFEFPDSVKPALWFDECISVCEYYQYHRIGHFWRKGSEHWRMLVYMLGTVHDKYTFLGPEAVNEQELSLLPLIHFGPLRAYSPVEGSLKERFPDSGEGWTCMKATALEAGDRDYAARIDRACLLMKLPFADRQRLEKDLEEALGRKERRKLFFHIYEKISRASLSYRERLYDPSAAGKAEKARSETAAALCRIGFAGTYPRFEKGGTLVLALEEHPFTVAEIDYEGFAFGIRLMVWDQNAPCPRILMPEELS